MALRKTDRQAVLTVANEGDPIPAEQLSHLFERFYRADASRGEKSGFGLGLAIAKTIMDAHKGAIRAESSARETRFICTFPLKKGLSGREHVAPGAVVLRFSSVKRAFLPSQ